MDSWTHELMNTSLPGNFPRIFREMRDCKFTFHIPPPLQKDTNTTPTLTFKNIPAKRKKIPTQLPALPQKKTKRNTPPRTHVSHARTPLVPANWVVVPPQCFSRHLLGFFRELSLELSQILHQNTAPSRKREHKHKHKHKHKQTNPFQMPSENTSAPQAHAEAFAHIPLERTVEEESQRAREIGGRGCTCAFLHS